MDTKPKVTVTNAGSGYTTAPKPSATKSQAVAADIVARMWPPHLPAPLISSFVADAIEAARDRAPTIARGLLLKRATRNRWHRVKALGCATVNGDHRLLGAATVAEIRKAGYAVLAYTVNDAARARELFAWGVSSVFSDVPHMILAGLPAELSPLEVAPARFSLSSRREVLL